MSLKNSRHNIFDIRLFDILPNFSFAASETGCDHQYYKRYIRVASQLAA